MKVSPLAALKIESMTLEEFSNQFDLHYNNITSNQAPGLTEYEKSVLLTKAQDEIVKNYFTANSKGNSIGQGFDDSAKRQADFSILMKTATCDTGIIPTGDTPVTYSWTEGSGATAVTHTVSVTTNRIDRRSRVYAFPLDVFIVVNESLTFQSTDGTDTVYKDFQVIPLRFDEYTRLMSKPYKRPLKNQAWRLINSGSVGENRDYVKCVEIITTPDYDTLNTGESLLYNVRYVRRPYPIIVGNLDGLTINGKTYNNSSPVQCELDPILHEDILQRAVELAKIEWTATGQDNAQLVMAAGQRSE